jgi:hypothetical protein
MRLFLIVFTHCLTSLPIMYDPCYDKQTGNKVQAYNYTTHNGNVISLAVISTRLLSQCFNPYAP